MLLLQGGIILEMPLNSNSVCGAGDEDDDVLDKFPTLHHTISYQVLFTHEQQQQSHLQGVVEGTSATNIGRSLFARWSLFCIQLRPLYPPHEYHPPEYRFVIQIGLFAGDEERLLDLNFTYHPLQLTCKLFNPLFHSEFPSMLSVSYIWSTNIRCLTTSPTKLTGGLELD